MTSFSHTIVGLPGSGKTTFLAALWHLINAGDVDTALELDRIEGDSRHLNAIAEKWSKCVEASHTALGNEAEVVMYLRQPSSGDSISLTFPDLDGESFNAQVNLRTCTTEYVERFERDGGVLLFLTADRPLDGLAILDLPSADSEFTIAAGVDSILPEDRALSPAAADLPAETGVPWDPRFVPTQVRLVELLQFLKQRPFRQAPRRVAIMISAWDVVPVPKPTPDAWLAREMPLLCQFLETNTESFAVRIYGVSAQGGTFRGPGRSNLLLKPASQRIECEGAAAGAHDLTRPVLWLTHGG